MPNYGDGSRNWLRGEVVPLGALLREIGGIRFFFP